MSHLLAEIRLAIRQLSKNPTFAAMVIGSLALGIGATAAIFSLVNAVVLRPLPFPHPERVVWLQQGNHTPGVPPDSREPLSYLDYFDWRAQAHSCQGMASYHGHSFVLSGSGQPRQLQGSIVSANFFRVLGVKPAVGRDFLPVEEKPGTHVAMLSHELWQSAFGAASDIAGRAITLDGIAYTVAGVMPAGFAFPIGDPAPALWTVLGQEAEGLAKSLVEIRGADGLDVVGRLKEGVSLQTARADLDVIARRIAAQYPDSNKYFTSAFVEPMLEHVAGDYRPALRVLFAAVLCLLLIACANVAGLLLVETSRRAPEIAVRLAMGAGRAAVARQMLLEALVLALAGGALGALLSTWIVSALVHFLPRQIPRLDGVAVDGTVLLFVLAISLLTAILFGAAPAWRSARLDPAGTLRASGRGATAGRGRNWLHNWIVVTETAVGLVLLAGSGLLIRSFVNVSSVDPGFDPRNVLTASIELPDRQYSDSRKIQFYNQLLPRVAALPGVRSVAAGWPLPLAEGNIGISFSIEGRPIPPSDNPTESAAIVTPGFFRTMRIPVIAGREFDIRDDAHASPVLLINERFARKYFPGEDPIGKRIRSDLDDPKAPMRQIVGVVGDVRRKRLAAAPEPIYYLPWAQAVITPPSLAIRTTGDPLQLAGALQAELAKLDRGIPLFRVRSLDTIVGSAASEPRFQMLLVTSFAILALALSAIGLYAVLSYMVVQRTLEIGLRVALGARPGDVLRWVLRRGMFLAAAGAAIGLAVAAALTRYMQDLLFGVRPLDGLTLASVTLVLLVVAAIASSAPAWRAARLDPLAALREQ